MPEQLKSDLETTGLLQHLGGLTEVFSALPGPTDPSLLAPPSPSAEALGEPSGDPGASSGASFGVVMKRVEATVIVGRRLTPRAPEWRICRELLAMANPLWHHPATEIDVDGHKISVASLLGEPAKDTTVC